MTEQKNTDRTDRLIGSMVRYLAAGGIIAVLVSLFGWDFIVAIIVSVMLPALAIMFSFNLISRATMDLLGNEDQLKARFDYHLEKLRAGPETKPAS